MQKLKEEIAHLEKVLTSHDLSDAFIQEYFDITQSKKHLLEDIRNTIKEKRQQLTKETDTFNNISKAYQESDEKLAKLTEDLTTKEKEYNDAVKEFKSM